MTVRQLNANIDAQELVEWQAFFKLEKEDRDTTDPDLVSEKVKLAVEGI